MKTISAIIAASLLLSTAAYAGEPSYWDNPMPRGDGTGVPTTAQINWALKARGEPRLGLAVVLQEAPAPAPAPAPASTTFIHVQR